ncbi:MAG: chemotaxis protein CheB, partial [Chloroflexi bacterium]|nr:chemotaxis protein CheB [Chloroflexota bacterium]
VAIANKPPGPGHPRHAAAAHELLTTVRLMAEVKVVGRRFSNAVRASEAAAPAEPAAVALAAGLRPLAIAIAASTGGPAAIEVVLRALGHEVDVPIFIVQHMSCGFLAGMVAWLASTCPQPVRLAAQGDQPLGGTVYLAPEDHHLLVTRHGTLRLSNAPLVNGFRPSGDVLFQSVAECYGARALGIVLTGMGTDGAAGLAALRAAGAHTIAQDEDTSVVYGMPGAAAAAGAATQVLPLPKIGLVARGLLALKSAAG